MKTLSLAALLLALTTTPSHAFSLGDLFGGGETKQPNPLNDSINKGIDSIGGAGTADV